MTVDQQAYEVVVGSGPAGLSTALYSVRLGHGAALVDRGGGRATMMKDVHNLVGTTEERTGWSFYRSGGSNWRSTAVRHSRNGSDLSG